MSQDTVSVIESGFEIMDSVSEDSRRVLGEWAGIDSRRLFQRAVVSVGRESFYVLQDVSVENSLEIVDVLVGAFYL